MVLCFLLRHTHEGVARALLVFVVLAAGIVGLNALFQFKALQVATDGYYAATFGAAGSNAIVLLLLLSVLLVAATVCYLADVLTAYLAPDIETVMKPAVFMGAIAEGWMVRYLLVKGVGSPSAPDGAWAALVPVGL
jgi:uncharacterized protein DUF4386